MSQSDSAVLGSAVTASVDFDADGVQHGHLLLPHSSDRSAWGKIMTPLAVIRNGDGPTALLTGGNHGDEYEGPTALLDLVNRIDPAQIRGRIIVVPMMNYPAFRAGARSSPIDGGNMNRVFPGRADGTPTEKVADYFTRHLLPRAQFVLDIHSGGKTLQFVPFASAYALDAAAEQARHEAAALAFAAPYSVLRWGLDGAAGMYDREAVLQGKVFVTTELGGGGTTSTATCAIARNGIDNFLHHVGILRQAPRSGDDARPSMRLEMPDDGFVTAECGGLLELLADPGDRVEAGRALARIHAIERTGAPPTVLAAPLGGVLLGRHHSGLVQPGDMVAAVAVPSESD